MNENPWVTVTQEGPPAPAPLTRPRASASTGLRPATPQSGVPAPDSADRLAQRYQSERATVWWVGVHGGSGESTLAALGAGTKAAGHAWPVPAAGEPPHRVVIVARTNHAGLIAAQRAVIEWASRELVGTIELAGLVLIADTPGRRPKELRHLDEVVSGGAPITWHIQWHEPWRLGRPVSMETVPADLRRLFADLSLNQPHTIT